MRDFANEFEIAKSIFGWFWKIFYEIETGTKRYSFGWLVKTTPNKDRHKQITAKRNRWITPIKLTYEVQPNASTRIKCQTMIWRLKRVGLYVRKPVRSVPLSISNTERDMNSVNWSYQQWGNVLFMDESIFCLSSESRRQYIWHESGTVYSSDVFGSWPL